MSAAFASAFSTAIAFSVPSKPQPSQNPASSTPALALTAATTDTLPAQPTLLGSLEVGLAGPPVVAPDGGWWLLGRDGEVERFDRQDSLTWSISLAATITGAAVADDDGILYVPTARDLVFAIEPSGRVRWRFAAPHGIIGPLCWVPGQGLALVGRDRAVYWLDRRANLLLRTAMSSRMSAGPTALGGKVLVGTENGQIVALTRQGRRQSTQLSGSIDAIVTYSAGALVLAGNHAHALTADGQVLWSRDAVLGIGVTAARGQGQRHDSPALLYASGRIDWLDPRGEPTVSAELKPNPSVLPIVEFAAIDQRAWIADESGTLWEASPGGGCRPMRIAKGPLTRPVLDMQSDRVMVGSVGGGVWSVHF